MENINKNNNNLKLYSRLFILLGVIDLIILAGDAAMGELSVKNLAAQTGVQDSMVKVLVIIMVIIALFIAAIKIYLGFAGIKQADGKYNGKLHITIAKIVRVCFIILILLQIINFVTTKTFDYIELSKSFVGLLFIIYYINCGSAIYAKNH